MSKQHLFVWVAAIALTGCQSVEQSPEPTEPETAAPTVTPDAQEPEETPDETFNREVDECFVTYRQCQRSGAGEATCFPPQEKCVVTAYRKLKKSRGQ